MKKKMFYNKEATIFEEALPLGNGRLGAMVYGGALTEKITLNEDTLWSGSPCENKTRSIHELDNIRALIGKKEYKKAEAELSEIMFGTHVQSYMPAGTVFIENLSIDGASVDAYRRTLDLTNATLQSSFRTKDNRFEREAFISAVSQVMVYRITSVAAADYKIHTACKLKSSIEVISDRIVVHGKCPTSVDLANKKIFYEDGRESIGYDINIKAVSNGTVRPCGDGLQILSSTELTVYISISTSFNGYNRQPESEGKEYKQKCKLTAENAANKKYEQLKKEHIDDYKKLFDRIYLDLGEAVELPTDERILSPQNDPQLTELLFDFGRYLLICSSREGTQPTNLQGIWNESITPPWSSDYHLNINTQMNYWPVEMCGLPECHMPFIKMTQELCERGNTWGLPGFAVWHNTDIWRYNLESTKEPVWGFWQMGGHWCCRHIWEHYSYTKDTDFLKKHIHILREASEFLMAWMIADKNGYLTTSPSTSPENQFIYNGEKCSVTEGCAMDLSIAKEVFFNTAKACEALGEDGEIYLSAASRVKPLKIGKDGRLLEWNEEFEEKERGHRHLSHLYGVFPSDTIRPGSDLYQAAKKSLEYRIKHSDENKTYMGWSNAWKSCLYTEFGDKKELDDCIMAMFKDSLYPNMLDKHPPFQIDGNFGICTAICGMILNARNGEPLRSLPDRYSKGSLKGLRLPDCKIADIVWENGKVTEFIIKELNEV